MGERVITVFGATGAQGGGLARAILAAPEQGFRLRAVTRKPESPAARALAAAGAEICTADLDQADSVHRAMRGASAAFCLTNFWEHFSPQKELDQAQLMAEAADNAGLEHVIWSTLEDTRQYFAPGSGRMPVLMGKYNVPHFDAKGEADQFFIDRGLPVTRLYTSFYWENYIHFGAGPVPGADGKMRISLPIGEARLPCIAVEDIGRCALAIFRAGLEDAGSEVGISAEHLTGVQMAAAFSRLLGKKVSFEPVSPEVYRAFDFPGADDLGNMYQFNHDFATEFCARRSVAATRRLLPSLLTFDQWLLANRAAFMNL